jgi:hypothetical protein
MPLALLKILECPRSTRQHFIISRIMRIGELLAVAFRVDKGSPEGFKWKIRILDPLLLTCRARSCLAPKRAHDRQIGCTAL